MPHGGTRRNIDIHGEFATTSYRYHTGVNYEPPAAVHVLHDLALTFMGLLLYHVQLFTRKILHFNDVQYHTSRRASPPCGCTWRRPSPSCGSWRCTPRGTLPRLPPRQLFGTDRGTTMRSCKPAGNCIVNQRRRHVQLVDGPAATTAPPSAPLAPQCTRRRRHRPLHHGHLVNS